MLLRPDDMNMNVAWAYHDVSAGQLVVSCGRDETKNSDSARTLLAEEG